VSDIKAPDTLPPLGPSPTNPSWVIIVGAGFGAIVLVGLLVFAFLAGTSYKGFICDSFQLLAAVFAFGAALSAAFMGGGAAAQGQLGSTGQRFSLIYGVGGGAALFVITFVLFSSFPPTCAPTLVNFHAIIEIGDDAKDVEAVMVGVTSSNWSQWATPTTTNQKIPVDIKVPNSWNTYSFFALSPGGRVRPYTIGTSLEKPEATLPLVSTTLKKPSN
jgi:hypothetical protein